MIAPYQWYLSVVSKVLDFCIPLDDVRITKDSEP